MASIDWKKVWESALTNKEIFPVKFINKDTISVSCPTRFSKSGELSIEITPSFNEASIVLELLVFNENLLLDELPSEKEVDSEKSSTDDFNRLVARLVKYELDNRIMERFKIKSSGFKSETEAENTLVDYINSKATESGRMFDDKLDELNDSITAKKEENYYHILESIRKNRSFILKKVESILFNNYKWHTSKNEAYDDSTASFYDANGNLSAVVSLVDNFIIVDLAKGVTAKVSAIQSDEDIEKELIDDVDAAKEVMANNEVDQLRQVVADNEPEPADPLDDEEDYFESLSRRITKLENLFIRRKLRRL